MRSARKPERVKPTGTESKMYSPMADVSPLCIRKQPGGNGEMMVPHMYWPEKEDCQNLNIWTPSIRDGRKRPVMAARRRIFSGSSIETASPMTEKI